MSFFYIHSTALMTHNIVTSLNILLVVHVQPKKLPSKHGFVKTLKDVLWYLTSSHQAADPLISGCSTSQLNGTQLF